MVQPGCHHPQPFKLAVFARKSSRFCASGEAVLDHHKVRKDNELTCGVKLVRARAAISDGESAD
jgi:hypothetical protein